MQFYFSLALNRSISSRYIYPNCDLAWHHDMSHHKSAAAFQTLPSSKVRSAILMGIWPIHSILGNHVAMVPCARFKSGSYSFSGHSFRRGAATSALAAGISRSDIMLMGRWKSDAIDRYFSSSATSSKLFLLSKQPQSTPGLSASGVKPSNSPSLPVST